jgi:hypothetical protein
MMPSGRLTVDTGARWADYEAARGAVFSYFHHYFSHAASFLHAAMHCSFPTSLANRSTDLLLKSSAMHCTRLEENQRAPEIRMV